MLAAIHVLVAFVDQVTFPLAKAGSKINVSPARPFALIAVAVITPAAVAKVAK
jgi:hypothetical protein